MKKVLDVSHGIVTSIGGFLEIGSILAAALAGAELGFGLLWAFVLGGICLVCLVEMSGRFRVVTHQTVVGALRDRFGASFTMVPLAAVLLVTLLVLATEITGIAISLELATGKTFQLWAPTAALAVWLLVWTSRFRLFNVVISLLGLVSLVFLVVAISLAPPWRDVVQGLVPSPPTTDPKRWGFLAAVALGASISPALFYFYSSGVLAGRGTGCERTSRISSICGMALRMVLAAATVVVAAVVLAPRGVRISDFHELPDLLAIPLGRTGYRLFVAALGIACFGAAAEVALVAGYLVSNGLGWTYARRERPRETVRFSIVYTVAIIVAGIVPLSGLNPIDLTLVAMAATAITLPLAVFPFLVLMSDESTLGTRKNRLAGNVVVGAIVALAVILAVVSLPHHIARG